MKGSALRQHEELRRFRAARFEAIVKVMLK
jgi:hypothetical protein